MSPLDVPEVPKTVEGKDLKINLKDPIELATIELDAFGRAAYPNPVGECIGET